MGSVPNCQKETLTHNSITWVKCKLKLPKIDKICQNSL